jgi:cytochrome c peroxidase
MFRRGGIFAAECVVVMAFLHSLARGMEPGTPPLMPPGPTPTSLKTVPLPERPGIEGYIRDNQAAIRLGKALFWDMQMGSDGAQACASCHFHAGADSRAKSQINPGTKAGDTTFQVLPPNGTLTPASFPFHQRAEPVDRPDSAVIRDSNDAVGSMGILMSEFVGLKGPLSRGRERLRLVSDPMNAVGKATARQVTAVNAPTVINAVFHYAALWDGAAHNIFNGANSSGPSDPAPYVWASDGSGLGLEPMRLRNSALASQAVGPPANTLEMAGAGRALWHLGQKMLRLRPLAKQLVHPDDSVLGELSRARRRSGSVAGATGLATSYEAMVKAAFQERYWSDTENVIVYGEGGASTAQPRPMRPRQSDEFTQMEANFALFLGLAVQAYQSTLVADDALFDRVQEGRATFTAQQQMGFDLFMGPGLCGHCHSGAEFTKATVSFARYVSNDNHRMIEAMPMFMHDAGFTNTALRPDTEGAGRGSTDAFGFPLCTARLAQMKAQGELPGHVAEYVPDLPMGTTAMTRILVHGAQKTPTLRNVELTGPYFRDGSMATLRQTVDFYVRGGNFGLDQVRDRAITYTGGLPALMGNEDGKNALVAFLLTLTDDRVRNEAAPFDHPQLFVANGLAGDENSVQRPRPSYVRLGFNKFEGVIEAPAVGAQGRATEGLPPLTPFLGLDPFAP